MPLTTTVVPPESRDPSRGEVLLRGETIPSLEIPCRRKDGSLVDVGASISPIQDETGVITGFSYIARDVSQRLQRDAALRESQRALQTLISNLPGMSYRWRNDAGWTSR